MKVIIEVEQREGQKTGELLRALLLKLDDNRHILDGWRGGSDFVNGHYTSIRMDYEEGGGRTGHLGGLT